MKNSLSEIEWKKVILNSNECDIPVLFTNDRVRIPISFGKIYDIKHGEDWGTPIAIEEHTVNGINWFGTILCKEELPFRKNSEGFIDGIAYEISLDTLDSPDNITIFSEDDFLRYIDEIEKVIKDVGDI